MHATLCNIEDLCGPPPAYCFSPSKCPSFKDQHLPVYSSLHCLNLETLYEQIHAPKDSTGNFACPRMWGWSMFVYKLPQSTEMQRATPCRHGIVTERKYHHNINYNITALQSVFRTNLLYPTNTEFRLKFWDSWSWLRDLSAWLLLIWVEMRDLNSLNQTECFSTNACVNCESMTDAPSSLMLYSYQKKKPTLRQHSQVEYLPTLSFSH